MSNKEEKFLQSPLNYTGSKFRLLGTIRNLMPDNAECLYDVFCGGGSVFVNLGHLFKIVHANDIISPLVEFYRFLQTTTWEDAIRIVSERNIPKDDQDRYNQLRDRFNQTHDPTDFFILVSSCTNNMMRFSKNFRFNQTWGKRNFNDSTRQRLFHYHQIIYGNQSLSFTSQSFETILPSQNSLVYLDPPYLITEAGYNVYWSKDHEENLYGFMNDLDRSGVRFMLSNVSRHKGKENPNMGRLSKYNIIPVDLDYDKVSRKGGSDSQEIVVINYDKPLPKPSRQALSLFDA